MEHESMLLSLIIVTKDHVSVLWAALITALYIIDGASTLTSSVDRIILHLEQLFPEKALSSDCFCQSNLAALHFLLKLIKESDTQVYKVDDPVRKDEGLQEEHKSYGQS